MAHRSWSGSESRPARCGPFHPVHGRPSEVVAGAARFVIVAPSPGASLPNKSLISLIFATNKMAERDNENFDIDEEFLAEAEDNTVYDRLLDRVDKRVRNQGKRGKAAWSRLEEVLADRKLEKDLKDVFEDE